MKSRLMLHRHFTIALLIATISSDLCHGTNRYYRDVETVSPDGRYHLTAKSPENADPSKHVPFQAGFIYVLRDTITSRDLWKRKQPEGKPIVIPGEREQIRLRTWKEESPVSVFVQNDGWSVLWLGNDQLVAVRRDGKETGRLDIVSDVIAKGKGSQYIAYSTAGEFWGSRRSSFMSHQGKTYFAVRTWWGQRIIFDLELGGMVSEDNTLATKLEENDRAFVRNTLSAAASEYQKTNRCNQLGPVLMASYMASQLHMKECVPWLRSLEGAPDFGCLALTMVDEKPKEGELDLTCWETSSVRQVVQLSLRRFGEVPRYFPPTRFCLHAKEFARRKPFVPVLGKPRSQQGGLVRNGMQPSEVLRLIGSPDFIEGVSTVVGEWQYDMDEQKPYTLIVEWENERVQSVERKFPALWQEGDRRDQDVMMK